MAEPEAKVTIGESHPTGFTSAENKPHLLASLAKRRVDRRFVLVASSSGQGDLTPVTRRGPRAARQDDLRLALLLEEGDQDRGPMDRLLFGASATIANSLARSALVRRQRSVWPHEGAGEPGNGEALACSGSRADQGAGKPIRISSGTGITWG